MANTDFNFLTLNARGLRDKHKRENLFHWLKQNQINVTVTKMQAKNVNKL